jgi:hypothetical protein
MEHGAVTATATNYVMVNNVITVSINHSQVMKNQLSGAVKIKRTQDK